MEHLVGADRSPARFGSRARILLKADEGWSASKVAQSLDVAESSLFRIKRSADDGLDGVLQERPQAHWYRKLDSSWIEEEDRLIAKKLECHHTPKHVSRLNIAEIECSIICRRCLGQRLPDEESLCREVKALEWECNETRAVIDWRFTTADAGRKLYGLHPAIPSVIGH